MINAERVIQYYDKHTADKIKDYINGNARVEAAWKRILQWAPAKPERILEIGCGVGYICARMAELWQDAEITGVDLSPESIENAKKMFPNSRINFIDGYFDAPRISGAFDLIVMMDVYEHIRIEERPRLHNWLGKRLSTKGRLVMSFPNPEYQQYAREKYPDKMQPVDEDVSCEDMIKLAEDCGAKLIFYKKISIWKYSDYFLNDYAHCVVTKDISLYNPAIDYNESLILNPTENNIDKYIIKTNLFNSLEEAAVGAEGSFLDIGFGASPYKPLLIANGKINRFVSIGSKAENTNGLKGYSLWDENIIPFDNCEFDFSSIINSPEFLSRQKEILSEAERALKPGGKLFIYYTYFLPLNSALNNSFENPLFKLERKLIETGFDSVTIKPVGGFDMALGAAFGYWLRQKKMPEELRRQYLRRFYPFIRQLAASDERFANPADDQPLLGLSATAFCRKKESGGGIIVKPVILNQKQQSDNDSENTVLAVFMPHIGLVPETFTKLQTQNILPGRTVIVTNKIYDDSWVECPVLVVPSADCPAKYHPSIEETVANFLKEHKVTHILNQYGCLNSEIAELNARRLGLKLYAHFHGYDASSKLRDPKTVDYYKWLGSIAEGIISVSHPQAERLISIGMPKEKIRVIHLGIVPDDIPSAKPFLQPCRILSVMRLVPKKSPLNLIKAFAIAKKAVPEITLDIIGDGALRSELERFIADNDLKNCVTLHGAKPFEYVASYLANASVFALHSITDPATGDREGLPVSIMEASAAGLPVVSTFHEGIPEAVENGVTGILVLEGDVEGMAKAFIALANEPLLRKKLGDAGRVKILQEFTLDRMVKDFREFMNLKFRKDESQKQIKESSLLQEAIDFKTEDSITAIIGAKTQNETEGAAPESETDELFNQYFENPGNKKNTLRLAKRLILEGSYREAVQILNDCFILNPDDEETAELLAKAEELEFKRISSSTVSVAREVQIKNNESLKEESCNEDIPEPAKNKHLKFMQVLTFYPKALEMLYNKKPGLAKKPYPVQINELVRDGFYAAHILTEALLDKGYETQLVVANCREAQLQWLEEMGLSADSVQNWFYDIVRMQIEDFKPDVLYCFDSMYFDSRFLRTVEHKPAVVAGWRAANIPEGTDWSDFDILFSNLEGLREMALKLGAKSAIEYSPGFPEWLWREAKQITPDRDVVFCGMWSLGQHRSRNDYLTEIARQSVNHPPYSCLYHLSGDVDTISPEASQFNRGIVYGAEMHKALRRGRIAFDARGYVGFGKGVFAAGGIDLSKSHTATMRMFEATGSNLLLLTEHGDNLSKYFQIGREIETYRDKKELIDKIRYYLAHPNEREEIAQRGFERCMSEHTLAIRSAEFDKIIRREYAKKMEIKPLEKVKLSNEGLTGDFAEIIIDNEDAAVQYFKKAKEALNSGNFALSLKIFTVLAGSNINNTDYLYGKAFSLYKLQKIEKATAIIKELLRTAPKHRYANILLKELENSKKVSASAVQSTQEYNAEKSAIKQEIHDIIAKLSANAKNKELDNETETVEGLSVSFKDNNEIKVSAIVSTYNSERFIDGCLEDLTEQTLFKDKELEIIVIDSASEQLESEIVKKWQEKYGSDLIRLIRTKEREGIYTAWNRGVEAARGKYLTNANTDDRHRKDALELLSKVLDEYPQYGLVYADSLITTIENETFDATIAARRYDLPDFTLGIGLAASIFGPQPLWRRSAHETEGLFNPNLKIAGDYDMFIRIARKFGAVHLRETLGLFLQREDSLSGQNNQENAVHEIFDVIRAYRNDAILEEIYPSLINHKNDPVAMASCLFDLGNLCGLNPYFDLESALKFWEAAIITPNIEESLSVMLRKMLFNNSAPLLYFIKEKEKAKQVLKMVSDLKEARDNLEFIERIERGEVEYFLPVEFSHCQIEHEALIESRMANGLMLCDDGSFEFTAEHEQIFWDVYHGVNGIGVSDKELERAKQLKPRIAGLRTQNKTNMNESKVIDVRKDKNVEQPQLFSISSSPAPKLLMTMFGWEEEGGGTILPRSIAKRLARRGWDISVFYAAMNHHKETETYFLGKSEDEGVKLYGVFNRASNFLNAAEPEREVYDEKAVEHFRRTLEIAKPDIVHFHNFLGLSFGIVNHAKHAGIPLVYTPHNYHLIDPALYMFKNDLTSWHSPDFWKNSALPGLYPEKTSGYEQRERIAKEVLREKLDLTLAISTRVKEFLVEFGGNPERISVVHQAPESLEKIHSSKLISRRAQKPVRFGFLGSAIPQKGVHKLIQAAQFLNKENTRIIVFGAAPDAYKNLLTELDKSGLVEWAGAYSPDDLPSIAGKLDAVVVPSIWEEGAGLVIMEALKMGLPVIGARIGGIPDFIIEGKNGFLYNPHSERELAELLARLSNDVSLLDKLKQNCFVPFEFDEFTAHLELIYKEMISGAKNKAEYYDFIFKDKLQAYRK